MFQKALDVAEYRRWTEMGMGKYFIWSSYTWFGSLPLLRPIRPDQNPAAFTLWLAIPVIAAIKGYVAKSFLPPQRWGRLHVWVYYAGKYWFQGSHEIEGLTIGTEMYYKVAQLKHPASL